MWILPLVGYMGLALSFGFLTLAIASGLYYLSELVEEHTVLAKKLLTNTIYLVIGIQFFLCLVDGFPWGLSALSVFSHVVYLGNMRKFPIVKLSDPLFISSCILVLFNHWIWFNHFSFVSLVSEPQSRYDPSNLPTFTEIASYFGICVWLVPFSLFVSLSASDNVLPTMGSETPAGVGADIKKRQGMFKVVIDTIREGLTSVGKKMGWVKPDRDF